MPIFIKKRKNSIRPKISNLLYNFLFYESILSYFNESDKKKHWILLFRETRESEYSFEMEINITTLILEN